jgi:ureidoacrylate peracid hydrolase
VTASSGTILIQAKPDPLSIDLAQTAILVIDMTNDFGAKGGMFERAGIDISEIQAAVPPTARVLAAGRRAGLKIVYLKAAFRPDLSDAGIPDSPNWIKLSPLNIGMVVPAPNNSESRILIRDTWNTNVLDELAPESDDVQIYKTYFSGFRKTELDETLQSLGVKYLIVTGCTTSICVESTIRDAFFCDYACVLLEDCTAEPLGREFSRSNHEASLFAIQAAFGWVSNSEELIGALEAVTAAAK